MKYYVLDENKNLVEAYDKEGVLAVLAQAIEDGSLDNITSDSAFISKIKCCVNGVSNNIAFITQAKYNELEANGELRENTYYYITDDTTCEDINAALEALNEAINSCNNSSIKTLNVGTNDNALTVGYGSGAAKRVTLNANQLINSGSWTELALQAKQTFYETELERGGIYLMQYMTGSGAPYKYDLGLVYILPDLAAAGENAQIFKFMIDAGGSTNDLRFMFTYDSESKKVKIWWDSQTISEMTTRASFVISYRKIGKLN